MRNDLIRAVLDCGTDDLSLLDDSEADVFEIVERMREEGLEINLNGIVREVFLEGIARMSEAVKERKEQLEWGEQRGSLTEAGHKELEQIRTLDPQRDFTFYLNCLDTHLNCNSDKRAVYDELFEYDMMHLEEYTGFSVEG